jgi:hypothetical protein
LINDLKGFVMAAIEKMLKDVVLAGRDEGYMEHGDNVSATSQIMVIYSGNDKIFDEQSDQEIDDVNNEIYDIFIHVDALKEDFEYTAPESYFAVVVLPKGMAHIRAVYEVDKEYLHFNLLSDYAENAIGVTTTSLKKVLKAAYDSISDE